MNEKEEEHEQQEKQEQKQEWGVCVLYITTRLYLCIFTFNVLLLCTFYIFNKIKLEGQQQGNCLIATAEEYRIKSLQCIKD